MTLTEQWKNGELEWDREYYVDLENNGIVKQLYLDKDGCFVDGIIDYSLKNKPYMEVLAPVPSYEEWQEEQKSLKVLAEEYCKEKEENDKLKTENKWYSEQLNEAVKEVSQLKELIKEAKDIIEWYKADCGYKDTPTEAILTKIDEVLK